MNAKNAVRIGAVHIIESLRPGDLRTGERLRDLLAQIAKPFGEQMVVHFWPESTRAGCLERLAAIGDSVRSDGRAPVIHIEAHGGPEGVQVTSGELLLWSDLKPPLTIVNTLCRLDLLVLLGACDGAGLLEIIQPVDRAPVWALIGPHRPVTELEIEAAHTAFYRTLFSVKDVALAWQAMNGALAAADAPFRCYRAEDMFRAIVTAYFRDHCSEEALQARVHRLTAAASEAGLPPREEQLAAMLRDHRPFFERTKRHFFMSDLCPEHEARFPQSLEDFNVVAAVV